MSAVYKEQHRLSAHERMFLQKSLQRRHNVCDCLLNRLFKAQIKETIKSFVTGDRWIPCTNGQ